VTTAHRPFETAVALVAVLKADTEALFADEIDHDEHSRRNRVTWDTIQGSGMQDLVLAMLRGDERMVESFAYGLAAQGQL
jgi:hypothetical protein